jgi:hypothetical protein
VRYARRPSLARYLVVIVPFALGLLAKPMLVTLPITLLLLDVWPLARGARGFGRLVAEKLPLLALSLAASAVTLWTQHGAGAVQELATRGLGDRVATALVNYGLYLGKLAWPARLAVFYPLAPGDAGLAASAALLLLCVTALAVMAARPVPAMPARARARGARRLALVSRDVAPGDRARAVSGPADRGSLLHIPSIGIFVAVAWGAPALVARLAAGDRTRALGRGGGREPRRGGAAQPAAAGLVLARQHHALRARGRGHRAQLFRPQPPRRSARERGPWRRSGVALRRGRPDPSGLRAGAQQPRHRARGAGPVRRGRAGIPRRARPRPGSRHGRKQSRNDAARLGDYPDAIAHYERAIALAPANAVAHEGKGDSLVLLGRLDDAITSYREALRWAPGALSARRALARTLRRVGRDADAEREERLAGATDDLKSAAPPH